MLTPEEQAKLDAEAKAKEEADAKADADSQDEDLKEEDTSDDDTKQLEAELLKERSAREKAEKASADMAFKLREKKRNEGTNENEESAEEDKPLTAKQLQSVLAAERQANQKFMQATQIEGFASKMSNSDTEKQLILEIHKNRSFPQHLSLEEQIEECYILANKKKILGENSELKRALRGKGGVNRDASGTHQDAPTGHEPKLTPVDASEMARVGFKWNGTSRRFEKKLSNGDLLVKDPKSKKTQLVKKV